MVYWSQLVCSVRTGQCMAELFFLILWWWSEYVPNFTQMVKGVNNTLQAVVGSLTAKSCDAGASFASRRRLHSQSYLDIALCHREPPPPRRNLGQKRSLNQGHILPGSRHTVWIKASCRHRLRQGLRFSTKQLFVFMNKELL